MVKIFVLFLFCLNFSQAYSQEKPNLNLSSGISTPTFSGYYGAGLNLAAGIDIKIRDKIFLSPEIRYDHFGFKPPFGSPNVSISGGGLNTYSLLLNFRFYVISFSDKSTTISFYIKPGAGVSVLSIEDLKASSISSAIKVDLKDETSLGTNLGAGFDFNFISTSKLFLEANFISMPLIKSKYYYMAYCLGLKLSL